MHLITGSWIQFHSWKCILVWEIRNALTDETCCCTRVCQNGGFAHISIAKHKIVLTSGSYVPHCGGNHISLIGTIEPTGNVPSYLVFCLITSTKLIGYLQLLQVARMTRNSEDIFGVYQEPTWNENGTCMCIPFELSISYETYIALLRLVFFRWVGWLWDCVVNNVMIHINTKEFLY